MLINALMRKDVQNVILKNDFIKVLIKINYFFTIKYISGLVDVTMSQMLHFYFEIKQSSLDS